MCFTEYLPERVNDHVIFRVYDRVEGLWLSEVHFRLVDVVRGPTCANLSRENTLYNGPVDIGMWLPCNQSGTG